jgi:Tfp pilus assembly protein PilF
MELKNFLKKNSGPIVMVCILVTWVSACAPAVHVTPTEPAPHLETPAEAPPQPEDKAGRTSAAAEMIRRGRELLDKEEAAAAVRVLSQAVNLNPVDGQTYYYLSEAWIMQQNIHQAKQYNRLAENYLGDDPNWVHRLARQSDRIDELQQ